MMDDRSTRNMSFTSATSAAMIWHFLTNIVGMGFMRAVMVMNWDCHG